MNKEKLIMLNSYIESKISPILLEDIPINVFEDAIILESDCDLSLLNGHYVGVEFCPPEWYINLTNLKTPILVIKDLNKVSERNQTKFIEILKYKKISTFELPKDCIIIVTCSNLKERKINEEVYSLMVHI